PTGATVGRWLRVTQSSLIAGQIYLPAYGALFDGVTDDTAAWQAAIAAANLLDNWTIVMPEGVSVVSGILTPPTTNGTFKGQGVEASVINWANTANLFYRPFASIDAYANLGFEDFYVEGQWSTYQSDTPAVFPFLIYTTDDLRFE